MRLARLDLRDRVFAVVVEPPEEVAGGPAIVGTATGVVNVAGFLASIASCLVVGWVLDVVGRTDRAGYRLAFAAAVTVQLIGLAQLVSWWLRARRSVLRALEGGEPAPVLIVRHRWIWPDRGRSAGAALTARRTGPLGWRA